jgi:hypothetical protein
MAAFGGIVGLNRSIDVATARALVSTFIEAVVAPGVEEEARAILATKANMRVVIADLGRAGGPSSQREGPLDSGSDARAAARRSAGGARTMDRRNVCRRGG